MSELIQWHNDTVGGKVVEALQRNNFSARYFNNRQDAISYVLDMISENASIGVGGSKTIADLKLAESLEERGHEIFNHNQAGLTPDEKVEKRYKQLTCDVFLTGANAITLEGEIINRDAFGNRVAAMMFGPKKVIIVAGINKIVQDAGEAERRIRKRAAPLNNKRYELPNPCVQTGECRDCNSPKRICNITTVLSRRPPLTDINVVLLGETLGF